VHSLKDLPTESPDGLEVIAQLEREDPRDVLVVNRQTGAENLDDLPAGSALVHPVSAVAPSCSRADQTSRSWSCGATCPLASARSKVAGSTRQSLPPPGSYVSRSSDASPCSLTHPSGCQRQGRVRSRFRSEPTTRERGSLLMPLDHEPTSIATRAERAFLTALEGGLPGSDRRSRQRFRRDAYIILVCSLT